MTEPDADSIAGIAARLAFWGSQAPKGLARVEFDSDFARQEVDARVLAACAAENIPFHAIELPQYTPADEIVSFLMEKMAALPHGVVSLTGWATAFPSDVPLTDSLRVLNYNRENLAQYPLCQIWWMTRFFTDAVLRTIPDLASWFIVRLTLGENIAPPRLETDASVIPLASPERQADARSRSAALLERFQNALQGEISLPDLSTLGNIAAEELREVGLGKEAQTLSEQIIDLLINTPAYQNYLSCTLNLNDREHVRFLRNLANLYRDQGRFHDAEVALEKALHLTEKTTGPESEEVAHLLNNLALLYTEEGQYSLAEPLFKRSLAIAEKSLGTEHPDTAASLNNLAELYDSQGRYAEAEPLFKRSLSISEKSLGTEHLSVAACLNNLAELYRNQGRYAEAEPLNKRSLAIREKTLGSEHPDTSQSLNNMALLYGNQGRYAKAEPLFKRSLAIREKTLGSEHPSTATSLNNLATLYSIQGRYAEAEPLFKRSLAIDEKVYGREHPDIATDLNNMASLYENQGRYAEAEPLYKRSLTIAEKSLGLTHPNTITAMENYADLLNNMGRRGEALMLKAQAEGRKKKIAKRNKTS